MQVDCFAARDGHSYSTPNIVRVRTPGTLALGQHPCGRLGRRTAPRRGGVDPQGQGQVARASPPIASRGGRQRRKPSSTSDARFIGDGADPGHVSHRLPSPCQKNHPPYTSSQSPFKRSHGHFGYLFHQWYLIERQVQSNVAPDKSQLFPRRMTRFFIATHCKRRNRALPRPKKASFGR